MRCPILISLLTLSLQVPGDAQGTTVVEVDRLIIAPGTILEGNAARLAYRQGKVTAVGTEIPRAVLESALRVKYPGTLVPGFVNPHSQLGISADLGEGIDAFTPSLQAVDAFDPYAETLAQMVRGGIAGIGLAPTSGNTFGGLAAVVSWDGEEGRVLLDVSYLKLALVAESLDQKRFPTSRMGAAELIRSSLLQANHPLGGADPDQQVLKDVLAGSRKMAIHADSHAEINIALDLCDEFAIAPILIGCTELSDSIERLVGSEISVILSALTMDSKQSQLSLPAELARAGVAFSFMAEDADSLRMSAALAMRAGLGWQQALAALTSTPASQCGIDGQLGSLRVGSAASFSVFSGDPLDLTSRLVAVYIDGKALALSGAKDEAR